MNIEELRKLKEVSERPDRQFQDLVNLSKGSKNTLTSLPVGQKPPTLSKKAAMLGLFFMNGIENIREKSTYGNPNYWAYTQDIVQYDARFNYFMKNYNADKLWEGENFQLLEFFFGYEIAPLVKKAWYRIPQMMYLKGYNRRSFRGPGLKDIVTLNQLNYLVDLTHIAALAS